MKTYGIFAILKFHSILVGFYLVFKVGTYIHPLNGIWPHLRRNSSWWGGDQKSKEKTSIHLDHVWGEDEEGMESSASFC